MFQISNLLPWLLNVPLISCLFCFLLKHKKSNQYFSIIMGAIQLIIVLLIVLKLQHTGASVQSFRYHLGGWEAPLGIDLDINGLTSILLLITAIVVFLVNIYSTFYFEQGQKALKFWPLWWLLVTGLNALFLAADAFNIYVCLEIVSLSAVSLVAIQDEWQALKAALRYLLVSLLGSLFYLLGVALLYKAYGTLDLNQLSLVAKDNLISQFALIVITAGLILKSALFPVHFWLPPAHSSAPAPVSAILSGLVVKASFYLIVIFWLQVLGASANYTGMLLLGMFGASAILWGSYQAIQSQRLKSIIAYSTVAQIGYLFLFFPLVGYDLNSHNSVLIASQGMILFLMSHALAKTAMFLGAGNIIKQVGNDDIKNLIGMSQKMPLNFFAIGIAGVSLIGLPPTGGFIAKWLLINTAINNQQWWIVSVIILGGVLASIYVLKIMSMAFKEDESIELVNICNTKSANMLSMTTFIFSLAIIILCFCSTWILKLLNVGLYLTQNN